VLGFFTLVSLVVAFARGGWWWALFIFLFLGWLGKRSNAKDKPEAAVGVRSNEFQDIDRKEELPVDNQLNLFSRNSESRFEICAEATAGANRNKFLAIDQPAQEQTRERSKPAKATNAARPVVAVNSAEFEELLTLPGIGAAEAKLIIQRRGEQAFTSNVELVDYLDLKPHIANRLDGSIDYGPSRAAPQLKTEAPKQSISDAPKANAFGGRTID
jgi:DNA uptake protein ComE-like DNA-binding protein